MDTIAESEIGLEQTLGDTLETFLPQIAGYSIEVEIHRRRPEKAQRRIARRLASRIRRNSYQIRRCSPKAPFS